MTVQLLIYICVTRSLAVVLLTVLAAVVLYGSWMLISVSSGGSLGIPIELVDQTLFKNFLVPSIILFAMIGVFSIQTLVLIMARHRSFLSLLIAQGCILACWVLVELFTFSALLHPMYHYTFLATAAVLIVLGLRVASRTMPAKGTDPSRS